VVVLRDYLFSRGFVKCRTIVGKFLKLKILKNTSELKEKRLICVLLISGRHSHFLIEKLFGSK